MHAATQHKPAPPDYDRGEREDVLNNQHQFNKTCECKHDIPIGQSCQESNHGYLFCNDSIITTTG